MDASTPLMAGQQQQMMMKKESVPVASMAESLFNLINSIIGAGVLTLPSAIKNTGYVSGTGGLLVFAALSSFSLLILEDLTRRKNVASYGSLADALFSGGMGGIVVDVVQSLYSFGSCIGYLSIIVSELEVITTMENRALLIFFCLFFIFPLSMMKSMKSLSFTSMLAVLCVLYLSIVLFIRAPYGDLCGRGELPLETANWDLNSLSTSLPIFCFAFNCQVQFLPIKSELENPTKARTRLLIFATMLIVCVLYCLDATVGYITFCKDTIDNILDNYESGDHLVFVARVAFVLVLTFSFPLYSTAIVSSVANLLFVDSDTNDGGSFEKDQQHERDVGMNSLLEKGDKVSDQGNVGLSFSLRLSLTTIMLLTMSTIVWCDPPLDKILGLTGALGGCALVYVLPGLFLAVDGEKRRDRMFGAILGGFGLILGSACSLIIIFGKDEGE